ncbi:MAG: transglutaminase family protein [Acidimicrobiia bacterium]|nr:transglutaminase family protein [Acidimicrobiia bacterium]
MKFKIIHRTTYTYDAPVTASFGQIHQMPESQDGQQCLSRDLTIEPQPEVLSERVDYFGNRVATCVIREAHTKLVVNSKSEVDTGGRAEPVHEADGSRAIADLTWTEFRQRVTAEDLLATELTLDSPLIIRSRTLATYAEPSFEPDRRLIDAVSDFCARIHRDFTFDTDATQVDTPLEKVLRIRKGVCQDFAHVMVGGLRSLGLPACYVSGYLETDPPPGKERLVGVDRTHAWVGLYLGEGRWIGIDPTNNQPAGERYITTARGRDYGDVPPMKGVIFTDAEKTKLKVSVDVHRI